MPGKCPDQTLDQAFGLSEVLVAVSTSRLSCKSAGKTRTLMPVWDSSGESRINCLRGALRAAPDYADAMFNLALLLQRSNKHAEGGGVLAVLSRQGRQI